MLMNEKKMSTSTIGISYPAADMMAPLYRSRGIKLSGDITLFTQMFVSIDESVYSFEVLCVYRTRNEEQKQTKNEKTQIDIFGFYRSI